MKLGELLAELLTIDGPARDLEVRTVQDDSRRVEPGDLFVAMPGLTVDGHGFAAAAARAGAVAVIAQRPLSLDAPCLVVDDPARALAVAAANLAGQPGERLQLVGVTGTNGKTTTTYVIEAVLAASGRSAGVIGTVSYRYAGRSEPAPFTTPTPLVLQPLLRRMVDAGCSHVVAEVSSHALQLGRVWGLSFAVAAFTHLTQDHLDLHGTMAAYLDAKRRLFATHLRSGGTAVINLDGDGATAMVEVVQRRGDVRLLGCSNAGHPDGAARLEGVRHSVAGIDASFVVDASSDAKRDGRRVELRSPLLGAYNADNLLLAASCCHALGSTDDAIAAGVARLRGVPGRLERVEHSAGEFAVLVDYAHTPDALIRAMGVLRPLCRRRLIVVFGCGGDRDRTKRPLMGQAVARDADLAVVTSDNPRTEDPAAIIEAILEGVRREPLPPLADLAAARGYVVRPDRRQAIEAAVRSARDGDIVLIAGKGHEDYQILGKTKVHFDDREEARTALENR
jgi:UDP-N-acetylmuramyl-tripeptide synthetase